MIACYPRHWNGSFSVWQRGTSFGIGSSSNAYTADRTVAGAGNGGNITVSKLTLNGAERVVGNTIDNPRDALRLVFNAAPTSGEGRSGYPNYISHIELRDDDVRTLAGKEVTVSCRIRTGQSQQFPFYLYISQGVGAAGVVGSPGNSISGVNGGIDRNNSFKEIFYRTAQLTTRFDGNWQQYEATFFLDDLSSSTIASDNVFTIGIGMDYTGVAATERLDITCLKIDEGQTVLPWREWPDGLSHSLADYNYQLLGLGISGFASSATELLIALPFRGTIKAPGAGIVLLNSSPTFNVAGTVRTATGSTLAVTSYNQWGATVVLSGFSGMTAGQSAVFTGGNPIIAVSVE